MNQSQTSLESLDFSEIEKRVFLKKDNKVFIGGLAATDQMKSLLRDQAEVLKTTDLYEIISSTINNEAFTLFSQASTVEHLQFAKAMLYWNKTMKKIVEELSKR